MGALPLTCVIAIMVTGVTALPNSGLRTWSRFSKLPFPGDKAFLYETFPEGFMWAVGTAAYQVEGAFVKDGKGLSIWDTFTRSGKRVMMGDVGSDSYHNMPADIRAIQALGVTHYRFSLSWARIFPNGTRGSYNEIGTKYYRNLIKKLKEIRVQPVVTLYHWDLPEHLQQTLGGWTNPLLVDIFRDYADFCFHTFGDDVKYWITIDNPFVVARHGYGTGVVAPGIKDDPDLPFRVGHILLKAHAAVWHLYHNHYRHRQKGRISMALASHWIKPSRTRRESLIECQCSLDHVLGWFARPLFTDGDYPPCMKERLGSKLPSFTQEERDYVKGTADFFALSHAALSFQLINNSLKFGQQEDLDLRMLLYWVNAEYDKPPIFIVQSGWYVLGNTKTEDSKNMYYLKRFIAEALKSIVIDGVNVIGYTAWSLIDGFEWYWEYGIRRGLYYIDFSTPEMTREPKTSATFYRKVIHRNGFPELPENRPAQGVFPCDFAWGVSANSIQVETMPTQFADPSVYLWNISNNGELIKMEGVNAPPLKRNIHCADYATIRQQVDEIRQIGVNHFHFSLNWSALVPSGDVSHPNDTLLGYYRCFTQQLLQANVSPVVTLWYHTRHRSTLPAPLNTDNKWLNRKTPEAFADYARLCYRELGAYVKMWITLNEPNDEVVCYQEGHQMLRAHALAWRAYDQEFRHFQGGQVSLALHMDWVEPAFLFSREDVVPAKRVLDFRVGWFAEPVFGSGDYPQGMRSWLRQLNSVSLPVFNEEDKLLVKGTYDFFAISHFSTELVARGKEDSYTYTAKLEVQLMIDTTWILSPRPVVPWGLRKALNWVKEHYSNVPIYVIANGVEENPAHIKDSLRVYYLYNYINEALKAYTLDGVNLKGYFAYALNDQRDPGFGLYGNIQDVAIIKASLSNYRNIIQHNGFPIQGADPQQCLSRPQSCLSCEVLSKKPVLGFLSLVASVMLITLGLIIYYTAKKHKESY